MSEKNPLADAMNKGAAKAPDAPKGDEPKADAAKAPAPVVRKTKPKAEKPKREPGIYVAEGKTVTSRKGLLKAGQRVTGDAFGGGDAAVSRLIGRGVLEEVK